MDNTNKVQENESLKKKFCIWSFILTLIATGLVLMMVEIPAYIILVVAYTVTIIMRKQYKMWTNLILLIPASILLISTTYILHFTSSYIIK